MQHIRNVSAQSISWVKSNKIELDKNSDAIRNLYYPENTDELRNLVLDLYKRGDNFDIIGYSSNTLFLPSYTVDYLICTKKMRSWYICGDSIICECGVSVASLAKEMVKKGYEGFYGLVDLPGTVASAVYGNSGCYGCSINSMLDHITFLTSMGQIIKLSKEDLRLDYRTSALKRKELEGVILKVVLAAKKGDLNSEIKKADITHNERIQSQPSAANNLGSTFDASLLTFRGTMIYYMSKIIALLCPRIDRRYAYKPLFFLFGGRKFIKYLDVWNRYMFYDADSHLIFPEYIDFFRKMYKDACLEIEIKK